MGRQVSFAGIPESEADSVSRTRVKTYEIAAFLLASLVWLGLIPAGALASPSGVGVSTITIASNPDVIHRKTTTRISGRLTFDDFSGAGGQHVTLSVTPPGGSPVVFADVTLGFSGIFRVHSPKLARVGVFTFEADYPGSATEAPASAITTTTVTALALSSAPRVAAFHGQVLITAHLDPYPAIKSRLVVILAVARPGAPGEPIARGRVDRRGNLEVRVSMLRSRYFVALWAVQGPDLPSNVLHVRMHAHIVGVLSGWDRISGGVHQYYADPSCTPPGFPDCPPYRVNLSPAHRGAEVCAVEQHRQGAGWTTHYHECITLSRKGEGTFHVRFGGPFGALQRVRAAFKNDDVAAPATTTWVLYQWIRIQI
jgi:hypothetical protein